VKLLSALALCLFAACGASAEMAASQPLAYAPGVTSGWRASSLFAPAATAAPTLSEQPKHPAVARIVAPGDGSMSFGSGTLIHVADQYGLVITNWHVINEATGQITVHFPDGFYSPATIQKVDRDWDLAILAIRRPENVEPVPLASEAPRPGDSLTIAGYGQGEYRAATGPCTQYVAPGMDFPFEMVEVAVSARQGDSGGPILNSRGELAGVLFGEGNGRTSGSYCGRVRWFLTSVAPNAANAPQLAHAPKPLAPVAPRPIDASAAGIAQPAPREPAQLASVHSPRQTAQDSVELLLPNNPARPQRVARVSDPAAPPLVLASTRSDTPDRETHVIGWTDLAGESLAEQLKTIMAAIGILAIILHFLKWMSTEVDPA
jgi:S1-C subfamily serine protease